MSFTGKIFWILLLISWWYHLTCSSVPYISFKLGVRSGIPFRFNFLERILHGYHSSSLLHGLSGDSVSNDVEIVLWVQVVSAWSLHDTAPVPLSSVLAAFGECR